MVLYATTIFLSAFLLFQVQPLIAKIILPWFGGSAAVWSAALLFFQITLLAGYAYAYVVIGFIKKSRAQAICHCVLLAASCALLPILPSPSWKPGVGGDPTWRILATLGATVGLQYFLLAATSPLLQAWYVRQRDRAMPYRLFALSNFGPLLALISFPTLVEPNLGSRYQAFAWSGAYVVFAVLCGGVAWISHGDAARTVPQESPARVTAERPRATEMLLWVAYPACASALLVSVTSHMSQDIAAIPLLWVVPLAVYLMTFILAFENDRLYQRWLFLPLLALSLAGMADFMWAATLGIKSLLAVFTAGLFVCCMVCHGEVARRRPAPQYLTTFYLMVALGGALGGIFVALIAPHVFRTYVELPIALVVGATLGIVALWSIRPLRLTLISVTVFLAAFLGWQEHLIRERYLLIGRNFYGVLYVRDDGVERTLYNGVIEHGAQLEDSARRYNPTDYFGINSGIGRAIRAVQPSGPMRVASIGLGAGVLATYGRLGDTYSIYEINPLDSDIAQTQFSFYSHTPADKRILLGDARLTLERQEPQDLDLLSVDAFTGDAIPVHLLTVEAMRLYFRHLKPHAILAVHISNRYVNLALVRARNAEALGKVAVVVADKGMDTGHLSPSTWVLITNNPSWFRAPSFAGATLLSVRVPQGFRTWTDDYSNMLQIMRFK